MTLEEKVLQLKDLILKHKNAVVFTGAGISTDSGIPDYRSPGSGQDKYDSSIVSIPSFLRDRHNIMTILESIVRASTMPNKSTCSLQNLKKRPYKGVVIKMSTDYI